MKKTLYVEVSDWTGQVSNSTAKSKLILWIKTFCGEPIQMYTKKRSNDNKKQQKRLVCTMYVMNCVYHKLTLPQFFLLWRTNTMLYPHHHPNERHNTRGSERDNTFKWLPKRDKETRLCVQSEASTHLIVPFFSCVYDIHQYIYYAINGGEIAPVSNLWQIQYNVF